MTQQFDGLAPLDYLRAIRDGNIVPTIENLRAALRDVLVPTSYQIQQEFDRATSYDRGWISATEVLGMLERVRSATLSPDREGRPFCSCKASQRDGQHMAWCPVLSSQDRA